jgi:uncharacterized alkaline shock family protein YloU
MTDTQPRGRVMISEEAIAELAGHTAMQSYGVVGMEYPGWGSRLRRVFMRAGQAKGIKVSLEEKHVSIDLYIVVENGTNMREISKNLADQVTYTVGKHTGLDIKEVNVHISNIKL